MKRMIWFGLVLAGFCLLGCESGPAGQEALQIAGAVVLTPELICNNVDDDGDEGIDEGCNEDGDQYCAAGLTVVGFPDVCPAGGGDCDDTNANIYPGAEEVCDGLDDNCDGQTDEDNLYLGYSLVEECYTGAVETNGVGVCRSGYRECHNGGWDTCIFEVTPTAELCDELDNNCNGQVDEDFVLLGLGQPCDGDDTDLCAFGEYVCTANGSGVECQEIYPINIAEVCDEQDNDCDGEIDEDFVGKGVVCDGPDSDLCANGTMQCSTDETPELVCYESKHYTELCDGQDNDCDGQIDEDFPDKGAACDGDDADLCPNGTFTCKPDGLDVECVNEDPVNIVELCNGLDDDCDGQTDEDFIGKGVLCDGDDADVCFNGLGVCSPDGLAVICEEVIHFSEVCDGQDNDCDTLADEDFPLLGQNCDGNDTDLCLNGTFTCKPDGLDVECVNETLINIVETCNNADDDCDGAIDNGLTQACGTDEGECVAGIETCNAGIWINCTKVGPVAETCNDKDDDCDGATDEGLTQACGTDEGECVAGIETCNAGTWINCTAVVEGVEVCDNLDNDCDSQTDEDLTKACGIDEGECVAGIETCSAGAWINCTAVVQAVESCNDKDDDCDSETDEDFLDKGQACDGDDTDLCLKGTFTCKPDGLDVECVNEDPADIVEICDNVDNDCDGETDEDLTQACGTDTGECVAGTEVCQAGDWVNCTAVGSGVEVCDNMDNDCDGETDEAVKNHCLNFNDCLAYDTCDSCPATPAELCDNVDNDCDGQTDEGFVGKGTACDGDDTDLCKNGFGVCAPDGLTLICQESVHYTEVCDGQDNDCDGLKDEDFPLKGQACDGDDADLCEYGAYVCQPDQQAVVCQESMHLTEVCGNDLDDDCNGLTDEYCVRQVQVGYLAPSGLLMGYLGKWQMTTEGLYLEPLTTLTWPDDYILSKSPPFFLYTSNLNPGECITLWYQNKKLAPTTYDPYGVKVGGQFTGECLILHSFTLLVDNQDKTSSLALFYKGNGLIDGCSLVYCVPEDYPEGNCQTNNNFLTEICANGVDDDCDGLIDETMEDFGCAEDADEDGDPEVYCDPLHWPAAGFYGADEDCENGLDDNCNGLVDMADPLCQI